MVNVAKYCSVLFSLTGASWEFSTGHNRGGRGVFHRVFHRALVRILDVTSVTVLYVCGGGRIRARGRTVFCYCTFNTVAIKCRIALSFLYSLSLSTRHFALLASIVTKIYCVFRYSTPFFAMGYGEVLTPRFYTCSYSSTIFWIAMAILFTYTVQQYASPFLNFVSPSFLKYVFCLYSSP